MAELLVQRPSRRKSKSARESVPTKRVLNTRLLVITVLLIGLVCALGYFWYQRQTRQVSEIFKNRATALEGEGRWRDAAGYLNRHLQMDPEDFDARVQLVEALERSTATPSQRRQLIAVLYQTLGLMPQRHDLGLKLANQLLETGDFAGAETAASNIIEKKADANTQRGARRVIALSLYARARPNGRPSIEQAATALSVALAENPADATLASATAELYRNYPQEVGTSDPASAADKIIDRLCEADANNPDALITRYNYRHRYKVGENAREDLDKILAHHPDHIEALLLVANEEISTGNEKMRSAAEQKLLKIIELRPDDPRGYVALAQLHTNNGKRKQAIDLLQHGQSKLKAPSVELNGLLAGLLLETNQLDEGSKVLASFDDQYRRLLPELTADGRVKLENVSRLLHARLEINRNDFGKASRELNAVIASVGTADLAEVASERLQAYVMRAAVMTKIGRLDLAAANWKAAADQSADFPEARWRAGIAYMDLGRPADAIVQLESYLRSKNASPEASIALVEAHLQQQTRLPPKERNWSEFLTSLENAKKACPQRWELPIAEAYYWRALGTDDAKQKALEQLRNLERIYPDDAKLWERLALCYQQLDARTDADRAIARYDKLEVDEARRALVRSALWVQQGRTEDALKLLAAAASHANDTEGQKLQIVRSKILFASHQLEASQNVVGELIARAPKNTTLLAHGLEIALMRGDFVTAVRWEDQLKEASTGDNFEWRYFRARRLVAQYASLNPQSRSELETLIDALRSDRPDWSPVISLAAQYAELTGNRKQAIDGYRMAIELGERRPEIFERLVAALYADGQYEEADVYVSRLGVEQPADGNADSLAIALAVKENRVKAALDLAKQAVDRGSTDPMHRVWLANLLALDGQKELAESTFRDSIQRFPKDPRVWNALFTYLVRTKQKDKAHDTLEKWIEQVAIDEPSKQFILAQGYELLGDVAKSQEKYRATITLDPHNIDARLRLAKSLLSTDVPAARSQFEDILKVDPKNAEARRNVASLLAALGDEENWGRAVRLLQSGEQVSSADESIADDRLRAILLSRRGRNRSERLKNCEAARRILTTRLGQADGPALDLDRMLLASIYEQEAAMNDDLTLVQAARDALRPLVDRENPPAEYLVTYVQLLLRYLERGQKLNNPQLGDDQQRAVLIDDSRLRIDALEASLHDDSPGDRRFVPVGLRVRLLLAEGKREEGLQSLNAFAKKQLNAAVQDPERAKLLLQLGNLASSVGFHKEAEAWYRQLLVIAPKSYVLLAKSLLDQNRPNEAVEVCMQAASGRPPAEVATVLTQLLSSTGANQELDQRVQPLVNSALDANRSNIDLLMSVAVRNITEDKYDEAVKLFRRVLELQPNHTLALNNLATLLAERPNQLGEANELVNRAISVAGRSPALLDTLGTIYIGSKKSDEAVATLEEAVAGAASDPRYYFHLALAYKSAGRNAEAQKSLETARRNGLDNAILTVGDRELLVSLKKELLTKAN